MLSNESTAKFEIELVNKQVQKIKQAKKDCQTHYGKQLGCGTCKALQLCMWIDELVDTIEAMRKHIEALQQENEQLQEFANAKAEGRLVKRGKWIYEHEWKCSSCGWAQSHDFNTIPNDILKYCPNCGAKMSKGAAEKAIGGKEDA